nr:hypothetical protein [Tanacetum cinerariifolium]
MLREWLEFLYDGGDGAEVIWHIERVERSMYSIHTVKRSSRNRSIRRWHYNLSPAESKFKTPMLDHQDKYMMKAQVHVSKSSTISDEHPLPRKKYHRQHDKSIKCNLHKLSNVKDSTLRNHNTDEVSSKKSQRNTTGSSTILSDSSASNYDSADESLVCSTPLLPLKKLDGITINKPSSAHARGNKSSSASKTNSAPVGKLKIVKIEDDPPLAMEYLAEFWYLAKVLENSKVSFSIPTRGIHCKVGLNTFRNAIGAHYLPHSNEYVSPPFIDVVRKWFPTISSLPTELKDLPAKFNKLREHIKKDKGKTVLSSEEVEKESTKNDSDDEAHVTGDAFLKL